MQALRVQRPGLVRQVWRAGALAVALGSAAPLAAQVAVSAQQGSSDLSAFRSYLKSSTGAPIDITGRAGRTTIGVTAAITSTDIEGLDDNLTSIVALVPQVTIGRHVTDRLSLEVPFSLQSVKEEDDDDRFTQIEVGIRPVGTIYGSNAVSGVVSLLAGINRQSFGDESSTRFHWEIGAGPAFEINDALSFRGRLVYGQLAEDEDNGFAKESYFGLNLDLVHNLSASGPIADGSFVMRTGASFTSLDFDDADGISTIEIPSPYLGLYFGLGESKRLRLGGEVEINRESSGDDSERDITLVPTVEYDFGPADQLGFRVRALGLLWNMAQSSGSFDESGTITGFGGGASVVLPMFDRYRASLGFDYLMTQENEDLGVPEGNVLRGTFAIELNF